MKTSVLSAVASVLLASTGAEAFWRLPCNNVLVNERVDPIVSPGAVAGHTHTVNGGSNFSPSSTFADLRASECTSCMVKQDMSAYWTPQLYFQYKNGSFRSVEQVGGGLVYYLPRSHSSDTTKVQAFPDGLRILTGQMSKRSYNSSSLMAQAIGWNCLGSAGVNGQTRIPTLPEYNCPNGLRGEIRFPSCWNGNDTDSADHFSHMAYPDGESGPCPATHPVRLVTLFYEVMWSVDPLNAIRDQALNPTQPFVLAMGDPTGLGYHGDFLDGWDKAVLQEAIDTCTSDSGVIQECPVFDLYDTSASCRKTPDVDEVVVSPSTSQVVLFDSLPGCNPVQSGPADATIQKCGSTPALFSSPVAYTGTVAPPGSQVLNITAQVEQTSGSWSYQGCYSDSGSPRALNKGLTNTDKTVEGALAACAAAGYKLCGIEYGGETWGGNTLDSSSTDIGYGKCAMACSGNPLQLCGGPNAIDLYTLGSGNGTAAAATSAVKSAASVASSVVASVASSASTSSSAAASSSSSAGVANLSGGALAAAKPTSSTSSSTAIAARSKTTSSTTTTHKTSTLKKTTTKTTTTTKHKTTTTTKKSTKKTTTKKKTTTTKKKTSTKKKTTTPKAKAAKSTSKAKSKAAKAKAAKAKAAAAKAKAAHKPRALDLGGAQRFVAKHRRNLVVPFGRKHEEH